MLHALRMTAASSHGKHGKHGEKGSDAEGKKKKKEEHEHGKGEHDHSKRESARKIAHKAASAPKPAANVDELHTLFKLRMHSLAS